MKKSIIFLCLIISVTCFSQKEGQHFCEGDSTGSYFPLSIKKKKIIWADTYYIEEKKGEKTIDNIRYTEYLQSWEHGKEVQMYLREESGIVYQYEKEESLETLRYNSAHQKGSSWLTSDKEATYTIIDFKGELETPSCVYKNLMVLEGKFKNNTFLFYYLKGYGYVGATVDNRLISFVTPKW